MDYPEIEDGLKPRHRFMSAYEQKVEPWDKAYQYLLVAAEPYETVAFKIPNAEVEKRDAGDVVAHWEPDKKTFTVQLFFRKNAFVGGKNKSAGAFAGNAGVHGGYAAPPPPGALRRGSRRRTPRRRRPEVAGRVDGGVRTAREGASSR